VFGLLSAAALVALTGVKSRWRRTWGASAELGSARI
jgi:MFS transporter, NNP family, nitrate/nitrite transporter